MRLGAVLRQQMRNCADLLLPSACHFCGSLCRPGPNRLHLCPSCQTAIKPLRACCRRCARPFPAQESIEHTCETCLRQPPPFTKVFSAGLHCPPLKDAIHHLKYRNQPGLADVLGRILGKHLQDADEFSPPELIVPVPLHHRRLQKRGYNQALEICRPLRRQLQTPVAPYCLQRHRLTPPQQGLTLSERQHNLKSAFQSPTCLDGRRVLLVDDVMTTGTTVRECSRTLQEAGATEIQVAVICRA